MSLIQLANGTWIDTSTGQITTQGPANTGTSSGGSSSFFNSPLFGGILSGLGSLATGLLGNAAANTQADAATNASNSSNALLSSIYQQNRLDQAPFTQAGYGAVGKLQDYFGLNPGRYTGAPTAGTVTPTGNISSSQNSNLAQFSTQGASALPLKDYVDENGNPQIDGQPVPQWAINRMMLNAGASSPSATSGTSDVSQSGSAGQLPSDFGSMTHDFSLSDFTLDPGYNFRQSEGAKGIERSAAARGQVLGGGTLKALDRYNQDYASNELNNAFNRYQVNRSNQINPLFSLAGLGQTSAGQVASSGTQLGSQGANINFQGGVDAGSARASGYASTANAITNGLSNIYSLSNYGRIG